MSRASRSTSASERLEEGDRVFLALSHATRRQILLLLNLRGASMTAGSIAERFSCRWPTVSRHLAALEQAGLVLAKRRGRERVYRLNVRRLRGVAGAWLRWFDPKGGSKRTRRQG